MATVFVRLAISDTVAAGGGSFGTGGTDRVDNVVVSGSTQVPEPSTMLLAATAALAIVPVARCRAAERRTKASVELAQAEKRLLGRSEHDLPLRGLTSSAKTWEDVIGNSPAAGGLA